MNNKGYTLVELLAVTVVLGLILVIAVPSVQNIIEISRKNTFLADAQAIYRAANTEMLEIIDDNGVIFDSSGENKLDLTSAENYDYCIAFNESGVISLITVSNGKYLITGDNHFLDLKADSVELGDMNSNGCSVVRVDMQLNSEGNVDKSETYKTGTKVELETPTKENSTFVRWEIVKGDSTINGNILTVGSTDTIVYAVWENWPNLIVDLGGGETTKDQSGIYKSGTNIVLEEPTRTGYTFTGWTSTNGTVSGNQFTMGTEETTITANWSITTYQISYELGGGVNSENAPTSGAYESVVELIEPTRTGYTFVGWEITSGNGKISGNTLTIGSQNVSIKAEWETPAECFVFDSDTHAIIGFNYECSSDEELIIPNKIDNVDVEIIGEQAFTICDSVYMYDKYEPMFLSNRFFVRPIVAQGCMGYDIVSVKFPNTIKSIGMQAFAGNYSLTGTLDLSYLNNLTYIGEDAFYETSISSVIIPSNTFTIGNCAFGVLSFLESHNLPDTYSCS